MHTDHCTGALEISFMQLALDSTPLLPVPFVHVLSGLHVLRARFQLPPQLMWQQTEQYRCIAALLCEPHVHGAACMLTGDAAIMCHTAWPACGAVLNHMTKGCPAEHAATHLDKLFLTWQRARWAVCVP